MINRENVENRIEKLKVIMLDLHRSAGELDTIIDRLEKIIDRGAIELYPDRFKEIIDSEYHSRREVSIGSGYDILEEREAFAWKKLLEELGIDPRNDRDSIHIPEE